ncbi:MAG TPA: crosslink repair DNA glycosylase YcaQ family protein, partial [Solirubrobacter sp.]|nr:crosslink repair DNA glycosylase YcaQ family protein [Solirubrobacter sp.]
MLAWRMGRQHLTRRATDALAVVSDVCGLHAQVLSSAQLTLWARVEDPPDVEHLLWRERTLVKTWAMRGTLHLLRADELPLYTGAQAALRPR